MWHLQYARAQEFALQRSLDAEQARLAHLHAATHRSAHRSVGLRRRGATAVAWVARHLDEKAAHEALAPRSLDRDPVAFAG